MMFSWIRLWTEASALCWQYSNFFYIRVTTHHIFNENLLLEKLVLAFTYYLKDMVGSCTKIDSFSHSQIQISVSFSIKRL